MCQSTPAGAHSGAIAVFTVWFNFTLLLGRLPSTGIYIQVGFTDKLLENEYSYSHSFIHICKFITSTIFTY